MSRQSTGQELMTQEQDVIMSLALSAALTRQTTSIYISRARFSPSLLLSPLQPSPSFCLSFPLFMYPLSTAHSFSLSLFLSVILSLSVTQSVNWCLCINECRSIEAWHDAQAYYHAFIFMAGNCRGVVDSARVCWGADSRTQAQPTHVLYSYRCVCVCMCACGDQSLIFP